MTNIKRIALLSETEINDLYARPDFNHHERSLYFAMNERENELLGCIFFSLADTVFRKVQGILMLWKWLKLWKYTFDSTFGSLAQIKQFWGLLCRTPNKLAVFLSAESAL